MKPRMVIVNEKDNIIGYKEIGTLALKDIYRVSALWITNPKGEILLARRSLKKKHDPGKWGPAVAGTIEEGENYKENIIKEVGEELGLKNIKLRKGPKRKVSEKYNYFCQWFTLEIAKDIKDFKIQEEVEEIKWFSKEELLEKIKSEPDLFLNTMKQWIKLFV